MRHTWKKDINQIKRECGHSMPSSLDYHKQSIAAICNRNKIDCGTCSIYSVSTISRGNHCLIQAKVQVFFQLLAKICFSLSAVSIFCSNKCLSTIRVPSINKKCVAQRKASGLLVTCLDARSGCCSGWLANCLTVARYP